jgi:hypothetical protein
LVSEKERKKRRQLLKAILVPKLEVSLEEREKEIEEYLKLFGYKPERTLLYVFVPPKGTRGFGRKYAPRELARLRRYQKRYGGPSFTIIGHTHDPSILIETRLPKDRKAGTKYLGSIVPPNAHLKLPPDFCPTHFKHEDEPELKRRFGTYLIALYVPTLRSITKEGEITRSLEWKRTLLRKLYRIAKTHKPEERWIWLNDVADYGYENIKK